MRQVGGYTISGRIPWVMTDLYTNGILGCCTGTEANRKDAAARTGC